MSLWRKRQLSAQEQQLENITNLLGGSTRSKISHAGIYNIILLTFGCALCIHGLGIYAGAGLTMLAIYSRSEF